jgi:hypothetical protein
MIPTYCVTVPVRCKVWNQGSSGIRMICTGTIIVVISRKYAGPFSLNRIREKAYAANEPNATLIATAPIVMTKLFTTYDDRPCSQARA